MLFRSQGRAEETDREHEVPGDHGALAAVPEHRSDAGVRGGEREERPPDPRAGQEEQPLGGEREVLHNVTCHRCRLPSLSPTPRPADPLCRAPRFPAPPSTPPRPAPPCQVSLRAVRCGAVWEPGGSPDQVVCSSNSCLIRFIPISKKLVL